MGPYNWRGALRLDLWVEELTWAQWIAATTRTYRKQVFKTYSVAWLNPVEHYLNLPPMVEN